MEKFFIMYAEVLHWEPFKFSRHFKSSFSRMYKGETKIIHNVDTCCAFGYTAGWAWFNTCGLLVSYCCGADFTLIVDLCHEFCVTNLNSPLWICTKEEQRAVIRFLCAEGVPGAEMHRRISVQYENSVVSQRMFYEWIERFENGRTSIKHEEGARHIFFLMKCWCPIINSVAMTCVYKHYGF
jgi:hypothetical protein